MTNRIFKTRSFGRWSRKVGLPDSALCHAVVEMTQGLVDANLGGGVYKKRVALPGRGKSAGVRTLLATNMGNRWFFVYGFAKNQRANISNRELEVLQMLSDDLLSLSDSNLDNAVAKDTLEEICHD